MHCNSWVLKIHIVIYLLNAWMYRMRRWAWVFPEMMLECSIKKGPGLQGSNRSLQKQTSWISTKDLPKQKKSLMFPIILSYCIGHFETPLFLRPTGLHFAYLVFIFWKMILPFGSFLDQYFLTVIKGNWLDVTILASMDIYIKYKMYFLPISVELNQLQYL